jgi:hypothetical protein
MDEHKPEVLCINETKSTEEKVPQFADRIPEDYS